MGIEGDEGYDWVRGQGRGRRTPQLDMTDNYMVIQQGVLPCRVPVGQ